MNLKNKRLLITEDDRKYIKKLYGLIKEAEEPEYDYSFEEKITFPAGYYSEKYMEKEVLETKLEEIINNISKNKYVDDEGTQVLMGPEYQNKLTVITSSGESQIPNKDNERGGVDLESGQLGKFRSNTINEFVRKYIFKRLGDISNLEINTEVVEPKIGETSAPDLTYYQGLVDCGLAKFKNFSKKGPCKQSTLDLKKVYDNEQFVKIFVGLKTTKNFQPINMPTKRGQLTVDSDMVVKKITSCYTGMKIQVDFVKDQAHKCNSAVFEVFLNGIKLNREDGKPYASLNNGGLLDNAGFSFKKAGGGRYYIQSNNPGGARYNTFIVSPNLAKEIVDKLKENGSLTSNNFNLEFECKNLVEYVKFQDIKAPGPLVLDKEKKLLYTSIRWDGKQWIDKEWGNGCHGNVEGVGQITITNGNGDVQKFSKITPRGRNERINILVTDPCKGEQGVMVAKEK